ncbi:TetR/AcrR family transcriptional regulator [Halostagnicola sp. A-GB9-2]|uniref:TetR/AcrR family transcriptional regulator n=1 Tax=Halostagnicola sp. A-GB9-2 TaxID=3048066 RepID=UPI0024BFDD50|nr:TetR/AcrR family transcriptional regulator [Halostagnicola sp. A-GB9-2]MDJ1434378.1 TetR/AcrR family transcriptional regulator [Halostagnicola sp. A-GB9-2]
MNETTDELMDATYAALCKHGYASLRMQDIADESSKSKSTLHYYYDSKQDLLYSLFDYLQRSFAERIAGLEGDTPDEQLVALIETYLAPRNEETFQRFRTALLEIKAQGPYDDRFRSELADFDRLLHYRFQSILERGQEAGTFRDEIDPDQTADFIVTVLNGVQTRHVAVGHPLERSCETLETYISEHVLVSDRVEVSVE